MSPLGTVSTPEEARLSSPRESAAARTGTGLVFAGVVALTYALVLLGRGHPYDVDRVTAFLPFAHTFGEATANGRLPLWSSEMWAGYPIHAHGQGGYFSPLRLTWLFSGDEITALDIEFAVVLVLAALSGAWGARLLGCRGPGTMVSGVVWSLGGSLLAYQDNPAMVAAFLPLPVVLGLSFQRRAGLLGLTLAFSILAGYPYGPATAVLLSLPIWLLGISPSGTSSQGSRLAPRLSGLCGALAIAGLLGAVQWIPTLELLLESDRWGGMRAAQAAHALLQPGHLLHIVSPTIPDAVRYSADADALAYLGLPALSLACWGAWTGHHQASTRYLIALVVLAIPGALLLSAVATELSGIPLIGSVRGPRKLLLVFSVAVALLAGKGADRLRAPHVAWLLAVVVALDLGLYGQRRAAPIDRGALRTAPAVVDLVGDGRLFAAAMPPVWGPEIPSSPETAREFMREAGPVDANYLMRFGTRYLDGYGPLRVRRTLEFVTGVTPTRLRRSATTHFIVPSRFSLGEGFKLVQRTPVWSLYRIVGALPLAYACHQVLPAANAAEARQLMETVPPEVVVLEGPEAADVARDLPRRAMATGPPSRVQLVHWRGGDIAIEAELTQPGIVVVTDSWYPGWHALVDGEPTRLFIANGAWKAVVAPPGRHRIELSYRPLSFRVGAALSSLAGLGLLATLLWRWRTRRQGSSGVSALPAHPGEPSDG